MAPSDRLKRVGENLYRNDHGTYFAWFTIGGKQIKQSLKTTDRELAKRKLTDKRTKVARVHGPAQKQIRFEELSRLYLESVKSEVKSSTYRRLEVCCHQIDPFFKGKLVRSIGRQEIDRWKISRGEKISARTFNKELGVLRQIFQYAADVKGLLVDDPTEFVQKRKARTVAPEIPTKEQFGRLVAQLRSEPQANHTGGASDFTECLAYSGARLNEAVEIVVRDIDFEGSSFRITGGEIGTKNHESRIIPLFPPLKRLLERICSSMKDKNGDARVFQLKTVRQALATACKKAGLPRFTHHHMRHFFCSNAIEAGVDFKTIAEWLGHKDGGVLVGKTYGHLRAEHSRAMAQKMTFEAV